MKYSFLEVLSISMQNSYYIFDSIPENCIAVGNPARVIKRYNAKTMLWERIKEEARP